MYMNKITEKLNEIRSDRKLKFMTHVVVGYPDIAGTEKLVLMMDKIGIDFIEMQIPFSDPLADGPTIMKACEDSLKNGTKVKDAFSLALRLTPKIKAPLLFMAYYNTVFKYGVEKFCKDARRVGISGLIVPDLTIEENDNEGFFEACDKNDLIHIQVIAPASNKDRLLKNKKVAKGFVYATARQGITDAKKGLDPKISEYLKEVKSVFEIPLAVGFGISSQERVEMIRDYADIAVVGSAVLDIMYATPKGYLKKVEGFLKELKK